MKNLLSGIIAFFKSKKAKENMARGVIASLLGAFVVACSGCGGGGGSSPVAVATPAISIPVVIPASVQETQPVTAVPDPVSISNVGGSKYAVVDYETLRIWDQSTNTFTVPTIGKPPSFDQQIPGPLAQHWHPTGVYFYKGLLYVANYVFHDVLVFAINSDASQLTLTGVLTDPAMVSPENVVATDQGVAVADYDASGVFFFSPNGNLTWKDTTLALAHGVTMDKQYVYVTTLSGSPKLRRYTLGGQPVSTTADVSDLLYPTQVSTIYDSNGGEKLAIIDANRGTISAYDTSLNKLSQIGHLGPDLFNRPYGFAPLGAGYVVTDTKNHRLVTIDASATALSVTPFFQVTQLGLRSNWGNGYAYCSDSKLGPPMFSQQFDQYIGFDIICTEVGATMYSQILLPHNRGVTNGLQNRPSPGFAFAWQGGLDVDGQSYWLVGSPTINTVLISNGVGDYVFATHDQSVNVWNVDGAESYLSDVVRKAQPAWARYQQKKQQCSPLLAFLDAGNSTGAATLDQQLDAIVEYPNAKQLVDQWLNGGNIPASAAQTLIVAGQAAYDDLKLVTILSQTTVAHERQIYGTCH